MPYPSASYISLSEVKTYGQNAIMTSLTSSNLHISNQIDINGTLLAGNGSQIQFGYAGTNTYTHDIKLTSNIDFSIWQTSNVNKLALSINNNGIGIGTSSPQYSLDLRGAGAQSLNIVNNTSGSETSIKYHTNGTSDWYVGPNVGSIGSGSYGFHLNGYGTVMTINTAGNIGIGFTNPNVKLRVSNLGIDYGSFINVGSENSGWPTRSLIGTTWNGDGIGNDVTLIYTPGGQNGASRLAMSSNGIIYCNGRLGVNRSSGISAYQMDVNGDCICSNWFRTRNNHGWWNETYQGGWYMSDTTWIRMNNNKSIFAGGGSICNNSRMGQGTSAPSYPLHILNYVSTTQTYRYLNSGGVGFISNYTMNYGLVASYRIFATEINAYSDERIKTNIEDIDDSVALNIIRQIEPKTYNYIDVLGKGSEPVIGFIAQQVESVLDYSVKQIKECIPDIYDIADVLYQNDDVIFTLQTKTTSSLSPQDTVKMFIDDKNTVKEYTIKSIINNHSFTIHETMGFEEMPNPGGDNPPQSQPITKVFVYGKYVDDFRVIDKKAIFTMMTAALQEVDRQLQQTKIELQEAEQLYQSQTQEILQLQNQLESLTA